jgi:protein-S-isoprenylcysteine O-methyltransferase Ste14/rhodanese-related sulfurtransferase
MRTPEWLEESRVLPLATYGAAVGVVVAVYFTTGLVERDPSTWEWAAMVAAGVPAAFLLHFSLVGLVTYFVFLPSVKRDGHIFSAVHGTYLIHPLTTACVLALFALCVYAESLWAWVVWGLLALLYLVQTAVILNHLAGDSSAEKNGGTRPNRPLLLLQLLFGGELVMAVTGAKSLAPWQLGTLPDDTWIVDVRTHTEFTWNRMQAAENYPWGMGVVEAARDRPKDRPVLVTCISGHRSPPVAMMLRKLGFTTVYHLKWGLLYHILLERGRKDTGPFRLTRAQRDPHRRGEDLRTITHGYVTAAFLCLIAGPLEQVYFPHDVWPVLQVAGAAFGLIGLGLGVLSFVQLGRNFRVYAAPRRSGTLITTGLYAWVRHPMYTGVILGLGGYALIFGSVAAGCCWLACSILYLVKAVKEERILADRFPEYEEYRKKTWRFLPFVH